MVLGLRLDWMILRVFSNLNDSMIATLGWGSICIVRMRNQAVKGWRATAAQPLQQGKPGLLCGLSEWAAPCRGTGISPAGWDALVPHQDAPPAGRGALNNLGRGAAFVWKHLSIRASLRVISLMCYCTSLLWE